ncbi:MAG: tripartite tricarboxylate transporter substrate binding protein [Burkholderiales bacterium]
MNKAVLAGAGALALACAGAAHGQAGGYPAKPIRVIVPVAAGGNQDIVARAIAGPLADVFGQQVLVDNRPSSSSLVGTQLVAKAPPDGYTLIAIANTFATVPLILKDAGYDPIRDFSAISLTCLVPQILVITPSLPVKSVKELIALAKSKPGEVSFASSGVGGIGYMAGMSFSSMAGIKLLHVPYKGNSQALIDIIGGQVAMLFDQVSTSEPYIKAGKLRALGVTSKTRSPLFPDLPTVDESGVPGYESITFNGYMAPAGTPRPVLVRLNEEINRITRNPDLAKRYLERGIELKASPSPEDFASYLKAEIEKTGKLVREQNIRID